MRGYTGRWSGSSVPQRTCVGCRVVTDQTDLLRVVVVGSAVVPDGQVRQTGRGAYVHPRAECLELAERRRAFARAFRVPGPLSTTAVAQVVQRVVSSKDREIEMSTR